MSYDAAIERRPLAAIVDLRGEPASVAALLARAGLPAPDRSNSTAATDDVTIAWLGPRHWLVLAPSDREDALLARLGDASGGVSVVLVSDAYASFAIAGAQAPDIIAQATPLDIHPSALPKNGASFTEFFGQKALLIRREDAFECHVDSSYGDYIADFLSRCGARAA